MMNSEKLRVLVAAPDYPYPVIGGLQKQAHELNQQLLSLGCEVSVLSGKHSADSYASEIVDGVPVLRAPHLKHRRLRLCFNALWAMWMVLRCAGRYDVVHIHNLSTYGALVSVVAWLRRRPVMMKLPNVGQMGIPGLRKYLFGDGILLMLKSVSAFVAMSEQSVGELEEIKTPLRKIFRMVNGINLERFDASSHGQIRVADEAPIDVVFTGRLVETKGIADLIKAWASLRDIGLFREYQARLRIIGDGPARCGLEGMVQKLGLGDNVLFEGYRSDIPSQLRSASIFVLPSYSEGNSNSILEAMAAGLPVISTDVGGSSLLVGSNGADYIFEPGDIGALERRLSDLLSSVELRSVLGIAMRERVEALFDIKVVAQSYFAAYREMTKGSTLDMSRLASACFSE